MTFLEACAALLGISSMAKLLANKPIVIYCDNIGTVYGFAKGYSRCLYAYTALKAIEVMARGINARVFMRKTPRCSGKFEKIVTIYLVQNVNQHSTRGGGTTPS